MKVKNNPLTVVLLVLVFLFPIIGLGQASNSLAAYRQSPTDDQIIFLPFTVSRGENNPPPPPPGNTLIVDHHAVEQFDRIPESYILAASNISMLFRHASVGNNISEGLDCLMDKIQPRPNFCDSGLLPNQIFYDPKFNRNNWIFEFHAPPPGINPGWWDKVTYFINRVDNLGQGEDYNVVSFKFGYVDGFDGSDIDDEFFRVPNSTYPTIQDLEELETRHPDKILVYWTMGLAKAIGTAVSESFNDQIRNYAIAHDKVLMDIADIESHQPDGSPCFDINGHGFEAMCDEYTEERVAGHLNALGKQRMAKAVWVLMARLAGWTP